MDINRKIVTYLLFFFLFLIIYNTLLPFKFVHSWKDFGTQVSQVRWQPFVGEKGMAALTDIVGNILLFAPFGFLLCMRCYYTGRSHPILWSTAASAALSLSIECVQLFTQGRYTASHDVINNTLGGLAGAVCAAVYAAKISSIARRILDDLLVRRPFLLIVALLALAKFVAILMPFTVSITVSDLKQSVKTANLVPFTYHSLGTLFLNVPRNSALQFNFIAFVGGIIFWMVVGYLWMLCYRSYWKDKLYGKILLVGVPLAYPALLEFAQLFITSRYTDINDVLNGWLGIAMGLGLCSLVHPIRLKTDPPPLHLLRIPLLVYGAYILFSGLQPFDWYARNYSPKLTLDTFIPFYAYLQDTSAWSMNEFLASLTFFIPISLYVSLRLRVNGWGWSHTYLATIFSAFLMGGLIEAFQIYSLTRAAGITEALAYSLGGAAGTFWIYYYEQQIQPSLSASRGDELEFVSAQT